MKQLISKSFFFGFVLLLSSDIHAQTIAAKTTATPSPTPQNVLAWAREFSPQIEKSLVKIQKISPATDADKKAKARFLKAATLAKEIIAKGTKLNVADAKKHDTWFRLALSESLDECLSQNPGSECCFAGEYQNQGWGGLWYRANCFTARFPDIN